MDEGAWREGPPFPSLRRRRLQAATGSASRTMAKPFPTPASGTMYDEAFIHEVGLVNERPALVPRLLGAYRPDFVVCGNFCFQRSAFYLREGIDRLAKCFLFTKQFLVCDVTPSWRLISGFKLTVTTGEIGAAFDRDLSENGMPSDVRLFPAVNSYLALNLHGIWSNSALASGLSGRLTEDARGSRVGILGSRARIICADEPRTSTPIREAFEKEAESRHDAVTAEFRAYSALYYAGDSADVDGAVNPAIDPAETTRQLWGAFAPANRAAIHPARLAPRNTANYRPIRVGPRAPHRLLRPAQRASLAISRGSAEEQASAISKRLLRRLRKGRLYYPDDAALMEASATALCGKNNNDPALAQRYRRSCQAAKFMV